MAGRGIIRVISSTGKQLITADGEATSAGFGQVQQWPLVAHLDITNTITKSGSSIKIDGELFRRINCVPFLFRLE